MKRYNLIWHLISIVLLVFLALMYVIPFLYTLGTSFMTLTETASYPPKLIPNSLNFDNYKIAFESIDIKHYLKNSIIVTAVTIIGQILVCIPAAYAFAKKDFKFKSFLFALVLFDLIVPGTVVFMPIYLTLTKFGWINTYLALTVPFFYSAFTIFFLTQAFKTIPNELLDSARIDKATEIQIISKILIPHSKSVIITVGLFTFISKWNDYFWNKILTTDELVRTLPMAVQKLLAVGDGMINWNVVMAGNVFLMLPMLVIYMFANKFIKQAFTYGGIK